MVEIVFVLWRTSQYGEERLFSLKLSPLTNKRIDSLGRIKECQSKCSIVIPLKHLPLFKVMFAGGGRSSLVFGVFEFRLTTQTRGTH